MTSFIIVISIISCLQLAASQDIFQRETSSIVRNIQHSKVDDENWNERPGRDQISLLIVFDSTGSMNKDLEELRGGAQDIVNNFASRKDQPIYNYVLSLFNDPCKFRNLKTFYFFLWKLRIE